MKKIVVTGGAGFIGSALVRGLLRQGSGPVVVIDNLLTGREENLDEVRASIEFHRVDIRDFEAVRGIVHGADLVFHEAAIPSVPRSIVDPVPSHEINIDGTFQVLRACREGGVRRVVYAASSSAYGDSEVLPKSESMSPSPLSPYALQKLTGEYYGSVFSNCFGLEVVSLRYFNVFGPRQDPSSPYSGVLSLFIKAILERQAPVIYGDGEQSRDFTYVEDVVDLNLKAAFAPGVAGKVYNAGNGGRVTLNEAWRLLQKFEGIEIAPTYGPPRAGDVRDSQADTRLAKAELGHSPRFTFEEGLRLTLEWFRAPDVTTDARYIEGVSLYVDGFYFESHEILEELWREAAPRERLFVQSLIHLAVAQYQWTRGNREGTLLQLEKAARKIAGYLPHHHDVDTLRIYRQVSAAAGTVRQGGALAPIRIY